MTHRKVKGGLAGQLNGFPIGWKCSVNDLCKKRALTQYWISKGDDVVQYVGIATDEPTRLARLDGKKKISLLAKYGYNEKMATELCRNYGLLSPVYEFTHRNGCWFCPNASHGVYEHMYNHHTEIFEKLLEIENMPGVCAPGRRLTRTERPSEIIERFRLNDQQMSIEEYLKGV